jgi:hypothetical protein
MGLETTSRRRLAGVLFLVGALIMLVVGETVLKSRLKDLSFLVYWLICFVLTGMAIFVAFLDASEVGRRTRREARDLLETTLSRIETDAKHKPQGSQSDDGKKADSSGKSA